MEIMRDPVHMSIFLSVNLREWKIVLGGFMSFKSSCLLRSGAEALAVMSLDSTAACGDSQSSKSPQQTVKAETLTIATGESAYTSWVLDNKPESGKGYEAAIAYAVAKELGYSKDQVKWARTTFDLAIALGEKDWDFNIQQFSITEQRKKVVDSFPSYYTQLSPSSCEGFEVRFGHVHGRLQGRHGRCDGRNHFVRLCEGGVEREGPDVQRQREPGAGIGCRPDRRFGDGCSCCSQRGDLLAGQER